MCVRLSLPAARGRQAQQSLVKRRERTTGGGNGDGDGGDHWWTPEARQQAKPAAEPAKTQEARAETIPALHDTHTHSLTREHCWPASLLLSLPASVAVDSLSLSLLRLWLLLHQLLPRLPSLPSLPGLVHRLNILSARSLIACTESRSQAIGTTAAAAAPGSRSQKESQSRGEQRTSSAHAFISGL